MRGADVTRFTCGDCHVLARALNLLTGWPIYTFIDQDGEPNCHAWVLRPDGLMMDVEGLHTVAELRKRYHVRTAKPGPMTYREIRFWWPHPVPPYSFRRAKIIAQRLVTAFPLR